MNKSCYSPLYVTRVHRTVFEVFLSKRWKDSHSTQLNSCPSHKVFKL